MSFVRGAWRFLVGVKDALALIVLLVFFLGVWAAMHTKATRVPSGSALVLDLDGPVVDQASERSPLASISGAPATRSRCATSSGRSTPRAPTGGSS